MISRENKSPLEFLRSPSSPTNQPASSSNFEATRRFFRSKALNPDTEAVTASSSKIPAGKSPAKGFSKANSPSLGLPSAANSEFSQKEFTRAYWPKNSDSFDHSKL